VLCCAVLGWAGLGWAGRGRAGLSWAGLSWAGLGLAATGVAIKVSQLKASHLERCQLLQLHRQITSTHSAAACIFLSMAPKSDCAGGTTVKCSHMPVLLYFVHSQSVGTSHAFLPHLERVGCTV